jgi:outer membrane lipoprotein-sorting protein
MIGRIPRILTLSRIFILPMTMLAGSLGLALAQSGPVDLHPAKPPKNLAPLPPSKPSSSAAVVTGGGDSAAPIGAGEAVRRANAYLNGVQVMTADFVQIGRDGGRSEGKFYLQRPGKMRFQYAPPGQLEIVADGRSIAVRDQKLNTQDLYFIGQTPLKFLLADRIDLARDNKLVGVTLDANAVAITIEDKNTFGGSATITLLFDPTSFALKQWTELDSQGLQTVVKFLNVDLASTPDPALFKIDETLNKMNPNKR